MGLCNIYKCFVHSQSPHPPDSVQPRFWLFIFAEALPALEFHETHFGKRQTGPSTLSTDCQCLKEKGSVLFTMASASTEDHVRHLVGA